MKSGRGMSQKVLPGVALVAVLGMAMASSIASADELARPVRFEIAKIRIELTETADDAGIQMLLDGEGWEQVTVYGPDGGRKLSTSAPAELRRSASRSSSRAMSLARGAL
jgi:hypothetical protein